MTLKAFFLGCVFLSSLSVFALDGVVEIHRPTGMCTKDLNPWGLPSVCFCQGGFKYDQRIGFCVSENQEFPQLTKRGVLLILDQEKIEKQFILNVSEKEKYKLILNFDDQMSILEYENQLVEVRGDFFLLPRGEKKIKTIIVNKFGR